MRTAVLLGNRDTKRTIYFEKAARQTGLPFLFLEWAAWRSQGLPEGAELFVKIDPPVWESAHLSEMDKLAEGYRDDLAVLEASRSACFLNPPHHITALLDKRLCKDTLKGSGLAVTEALTGPVADAASLLSCMEAERVFQVFIKPAFGSGAAGVTAFRWQPKTGRMAAYSCALLRPGAPDPGLVNTKKLRSFTDPKEILPLLDQLLKLPCVVERWYPKADYQGYSYDLRAVCQDGAVDFLLARLSKGPVTNLHLNNHPLEAAKLDLPDRVLQDIGELCSRVAGCYPWLLSVGIDILLERGSLRPRIIEMNGQGDLLYQDIYSDNKIYSHQADMMKSWLEHGGKI